MAVTSTTAQLTDAVGSRGVHRSRVMAIDARLPAGGEIVMLFAGAPASGALAHHAPAAKASVSAAPAVTQYRPNGVRRLVLRKRRRNVTAT